MSSNDQRRCGQWSADERSFFVTNRDESTAMEHAELQLLLQRLLARWENEVVEFKQAGDGFSTDDIGRYFSALANEANVRNVDFGWLVFGINDKTRKVVGTDYRPEPERLQGLKMQVAQGTEPRITFREIHTLQLAEGRVLMFEVPSAPRGMPIAWKGHYYARAGESLISLGLDKLDEIRQQTLSQDWTAQVVPGATLTDLDDTAVAKARESFAKKYANRFRVEDVLRWPLSAFLDRARLTWHGQITRATLLLLGGAESAWSLSPHPAQLTWKLEGPERAYEHFGPPFFINTTRLYQRIRNVQLRILPQDELLPVEISKYDQKVVLEALHNCIAHQDYRRNGRVVVVEKPGSLIFENEGDFFDGKPDDYIEGYKVPHRYRNPFLAQAMAELNMIDTIGCGIHEMHARQAQRYLPMPDYDLHDVVSVKMTVYGGLIDPAYSRMLIQKVNLPLADVLALDRVQKRLPIPEEAVVRLRKAGLIEGRKPHLHVSANIAQATASKADYIRTRAQSDEFYAKLLTDYLERFDEATRAEINQLLLDKLSDVLTDKQKVHKINNLLSKLRNSGLILNAGTDSAPRWRLTGAKKQEN
jgi:ATP-dependent DNA helicase RecG